MAQQHVNMFRAAGIKYTEDACLLWKIITGEKEVESWKESKS